KQPTTSFRSLQTRLKLPDRMTFRSGSFNHDITLERHSYLDRPSQRALVRVVEFSFPAFEM
ncbi:MAG: hypothetical protein ACXVZH_13315, partial [Terriglobales bacterium]